MLHCLGSCDFADFFSANFPAIFDAIVADGHVKETILQCFKHSGRDHLRATARERHAALANAVLQHITANELPHLEHESSERANVALALSETVFEQLQNTETYSDVRTFDDGISGCHAFAVCDIDINAVSASGCATCRQLHQAHRLTKLIEFAAQRPHAHPV